MFSDLTNYSRVVRSICRKRLPSFPGYSLEDLEQEVWYRLCRKKKKGSLDVRYIERTIHQALTDAWRVGIKNKPRLGKDLIVIAVPAARSPTRVEFDYAIDYFPSRASDLESIVEAIGVLEEVGQSLNEEELYAFYGLLEGYSAVEMSKMQNPVWLHSVVTEKSRLNTAYKIRRKVREKVRKIFYENPDRENLLQSTRRLARNGNTAQVASGI